MAAEVRSSPKVCKALSRSNNGNVNPNWDFLSCYAGDKRPSNMPKPPYTKFYLISEGINKTETST
jgi:hypothetical protein